MRQPARHSRQFFLLHQNLHANEPIPIHRKPPAGNRLSGTNCSGLNAMISYEDVKILGEAVEARNKKHYEWLRSLVLLASASLAVIVSLHSEKPVGSALIYAKATWVALGLGILLGSISLHGDVWTADALVKNLAGQIAQPNHGKITIHVPLPWRYRAATKLCYGCLICAVVSFVLYALKRY